MTTWDYVRIDADVLSAARKRHGNAVVDGLALELVPREHVWWLLCVLCCGLRLCTGRSCEQWDSGALACRLQDEADADVFGEHVQLFHRAHTASCPRPTIPLPREALITDDEHETGCPRAREVTQRTDQGPEHDDDTPIGGP